MIHPEIVQYIPAIRELCREYGVARLEIFGSAATDDFDPERSDVDFIVTYPDGYDFGSWGSRFIDLERQLSLVLSRDVDLITSAVLAKKNVYFRREVDASRKAVFDASEVSSAA